LTDQNPVRKGPSPLVRIGGRYGVISAISLITGISILYYAGKHPLLINVFFDLRILVFILFIFIALREFREDFNNKILHFWQGIYIGLLVYIIAALLTSLFIWVFAGWIEPDFLNSFISTSMENLQINKEIIIESLGEKNYQAAIEGLPTTSANNLAFDYFLKSMPIGFILTFIIAIFLRKKV
jgi:hypothetical protein